jgi:hypothetical protein
MSNRSQRLSKHIDFGSDFSLNLTQISSSNRGSMNYEEEL